MLIENRPSKLGKVCQALADQEVNILAFESFATRGKFVTRFIVDNPDTPKTVLNNEKLTAHPTADARISRAPSHPSDARLRIVNCRVIKSSDAQRNQKPLP